MFNLFLDVSNYLCGKGINVPNSIFWILLFFAIIALSITSYQKYLKPIIKDLKIIDRKIKRIDEIDNIKEVQAKAIEKSIKADNELQKGLDEINVKLDNVTKMFIDKQISDMRYEILDFGNAVINGRKYGKEAYDHILDVYNEYENILTNNNMSNGRVSTTIEVIRDSYKKMFLNLINNSEN